MQTDASVVKPNLPERLDEFRTALEEEITSAKRAAFGNSISLIYGRRIAQIGKKFQYVFHLENSLNFPGDAPGDLHLPNRQPLEITIVAVDGMTIILSCPVDLGEYIPHARLVSDLTFLLRRLIERIEELAETTNEVGDRILTNSGVSGNVPQIEMGKLNTKQREAVEASLGRNLTFIWGPPGTGKTLTIGSIGFQLFIHDRSLLVVSHTNTAVDQALLRIVGDNSNEAIQEAIQQGKILRVGEPKDQRLHDHPNLLLQTHVERRSEELSAQLALLEEELTEKQALVIELTKQIDLFEWFTTSRNDLEEMRFRRDKLKNMESELKDAKIKFDELSKQSSYWSEAKKHAESTTRKMASIATINKKLDKMQTQYQEIISESKTVIEKRTAAETLLAETKAVNWIVRKWKRLPSPEVQEQIVNKFRAVQRSLETDIASMSSEIKRLESESAQLAKECADFISRYRDKPDELIKKEGLFRVELGQSQTQVDELPNNCMSFRQENTRLFRERYEILAELGFIENGNGTVEEMYLQIEAAFGRIEKIVAQFDINEVRLTLERNVNRINQIESNISSIKDILSRIEEVIISEADIVATTLTRAYLNDAIRSRRYDTIIIDEASMAPIPAIWVAASLITNNAVVVGDPKQLPPIVTSTHELAMKWLGRDVFDISGVMESPVGNLVPLKEQRRMHPDIASIPNELIYDGILVNYDGILVNELFHGWYNPHIKSDSSVILIDTGPLNAWVTSVPRGRGSSRLNFLSATLCIDLCQLLLRADRPEPSPDETNRIIIECPYRPHAKLLDLMLRDNDIDKDVRVGTVHTFQGSEAEIVIFDLVNDEPHWRVGLFMPANDENTKRLINVGITRARQRLIVVGDFAYIQKLSKKAFFGSDFIPYLTANFPIFNALDVLPVNILERAAEATKLMSQGTVESDSTRIIVTHESFYPLFIDDISSAKSRVVIYSPFITQNRLAEMQATFRAATEKGIQIYVVTKSLQDRRRRDIEQYRILERSLEEWGVVVVHKKGMHEKLVFIDDSIIWIGSLNPLSFTDTQEIMERRVSKTLVIEYSRVLRLKELVGEYADGSPPCPICQSEIVASEGRDDPYFWRCVIDDCYSRSIDSPRLEGGIITCSNCGGDVEFGSWGKNPAWRCITNRRHHQKLAKTHLRLPEMRKKIPPEKLINLEVMFGLSKDE